MSFDLGQILITAGNLDNLGKWPYNTYFRMHQEYRGATGKNLGEITIWYLL